MSTLDNNKKKRDQKSSETEKELALAQLQDRFLGSKAPQADFLKKVVIGISPALLPKKDKVKTQTNETSQTLIAPAVTPVISPGVSSGVAVEAKATDSHQTASVSVSADTINVDSESNKIQAPMPSVSSAASSTISNTPSPLIMPDIEPKLDTKQEVVQNNTTPEKIQANINVTKDNQMTDNKTATKSVSSFDFLNVGLSSSISKTKSFLAHFAKKAKPSLTPNTDKAEDKSSESDDSDTPSDPSDQSK